MLTRLRQLIDASFDSPPRRVLPICLALCLLAATAPAAAATGGPSADNIGECDLELDPPADAGYDTNVVGYTASTNTYHATLTITGDALPCTNQTRNQLRAIRQVENRLY